jgi:cellulose biosynthesis protein BcsQ
VDLDLQGSLSGIYLDEDRMTRLANEGKMLENFLHAAFDAEHPDLRNYVQPILSDNRSGLVPTTDTLVYEELNLTIRWILRQGSKDPRFLLRRELQLKRIAKDYDIVLLDCPPFLNISCVNALAASDYLLVPVMPSKQSTIRVPVLLKKLREIKQTIHPELKVLGVLANRTYGSTLTSNEQNRLTLLRDQCRDVFGMEIPQFTTLIRQSVQVRSAEDENRPLREGDDLFESFRDLADEVASRLPAFCLQNVTSWRAAKRGVVA